MNVHIFSGTSEGRALCGFLSEHGVQADAYVATGYGERTMDPLPGITVHTGRLTADEMAQRLNKRSLVVDATHPYAAEVTKNIRAASERAGAEYLRLNRPTAPMVGIETVADTAAAVAWLNKHPGQVLLTTGSKELHAYTGVEDYRKRLFPRVLPTAKAIQKCESLGFPNAHILAMQGPFSHEMNVAMLKSIGAEILVTKDTGEAGGFVEKLSAARETGAQILVISRPTEEQGRTLEETRLYLTARLGLDQVLRFPIFVSLSGHRCMVFGAGKIAERRAVVLRRFGANVRVIAPESRSGLTPDERRVYVESDLMGAYLAVAATDNRAVNQQIGADCRQRGIPCSVADSAAESTFFFPAICEGKDLIAGVVSAGSGHQKTAEAAKRIRAVLEGLDAEDTSRKS